MFRTGTGDEVINSLETAVTSLFIFHYKERMKHHRRNKLPLVQLTQIPMKESSSEKLGFKDIKYFVYIEAFKFKELRVCCDPRGRLRSIQHKHIHKTIESSLLNESERFTNIKDENDFSFAQPLITWNIFRHNLEPISYSSKADASRRECNKIISFGSLEVIDNLSTHCRQVASNSLPCT